MKYSQLAAWAGGLGVFFTAAVISVSAATQVEPEGVTKAIRKQMDRQFTGWAIAGVPGCVGASNPITADIDFDQSPDVAMVVQTGGESHVVIAMPRVLGGAIVFDLGPLSAIPGATHLVVLPQGRVVSAPGAMLVDYLSGPTFAAASCDGPLVAFVWTGYGFRRVTVA